MPVTKIGKVAHVLRAVIRYPSRLRILFPVLLVLSCLFIMVPVRGDEVSAHNNEGPAVYIADYESDGDTRTPCYWLNGVQHILPIRSEGSAIAVTTFNVYIAGYEYNADHNTMPCYWRNGVQYTLPVTAGSFGEALAIALR